MPEGVPAHDPPARELDVTRARRETPGVEHVAHFNNAGAALMPEPVVEAVISHLRLESEIGGYEAATRAEAAVDGVYAAAGRLLNADTTEIAIVDNATRAWTAAFYSLPLGEGDRILTGASEYVSNYLGFLQVTKRTGAVVEAVPSDPSGQISVDALADMIDDRTKLIAITHVPTNGGLVNPAAAIGRVAGQAGVPYLLDACQSVGQMPIDVKAIGCDMLSATGRKYLRGPRGTGLLYVRRGLAEKLEPAVIDLGSADWVEKDRYEIRPGAKRFELWESYMAGKSGLRVAMDYARSWGLDVSYARIQKLADQIRAGLRDIPGATVHDLGVEQCGIVSFALDGHDPADVTKALSEQAINTSVSTANMTRLDMDSRGLDSLIRASVHYYNSDDEIQRLLQAVNDL
ncbi:MAG: aminotransferase class V-fold PLP-dependent enzyme [Alphaproteobacteria bacterium]|nr:aminotransferase class V-fold PLP-dependent enzyme [Alphaproteobacteria bacterium]MBT5860765.1 aminotransferase class V-fold PLP-dependent enzyme [Alphaproteobacteria bacterium]